MAKKPVEVVKDEEVPERVWGEKKPKPTKRTEPAEIVEPIDWDYASRVLTFAEYHALRKEKGLDL